MNRTAVKNFAQWARKHLIEQAKSRLALFGVTEKGIEAPKRIEGGLIVGSQTLALSATDLGQYDSLVKHYHDLSGTAKDKFNALTDEIAYTWFNRLAALRYMEVHGFAERALSSDQPGVTDPNLLRDAMSLASGGELPNVTPDLLDEWQRLYQPGEIYRRLLVAQATAFAPTMPFLFEGKAWLDLFLPDTLLNQDSIVRRMVEDIPEEDWQDIEIVGWLYQFYISERKDEVFAQKGKYTPRDIPAATQLFTPHWIVRYMVENSLGRVWLEAHPESGLKAQMPYYLDSENPAPEPKPDLKPEDLTVMDPACGSGHILVYAFDLLAHIYREQGHSDRDIPALILEHNLHGLDIDERAAQLASFAVVMKARELNSRLLRREMPTLNILQVRSTRGLALPNAGGVDMLGQFSTLSGGLTDADEFNPNDWQPLLSAFEDADHLGSLITPPAFSAERLRAQLHWLEQQGGLDSTALDDLRHLLKQAELLAKKYDAVVANPPYMGGAAYTPTLKTWIEKAYPRSKSDLFAVFMERIMEMTNQSGLSGMVTMQSWMFLSSYEKLREHIINNHSIVTLTHMDNMVMRIAFGTAAFILSGKKRVGDGVYTWLEMSDLDDENPRVFPAANERNSRGNNNLFRRSQSDFEKIPGSPIAYWVPENIFDSFIKYPALVKLSELQPGLQTSNNERFIRAWHEVPLMKTLFTAESSEDAFESGLKWFPIVKGGDFRLWYGNHNSVVNWEADGAEIKSFVKDKYPYLKGNIDYVIKDRGRYFRPNVSWTKISSGAGFGVRQTPQGFIIDVAGSGIFPRNISIESVTAIMCSKAANYFISISNPTINTQVGDVEIIPVNQEFAESVEVKDLANSAVSLSKTDWDNFETSWDFQTHPLLRHSTPSLPEAFSRWEAQSEAAFRELQRLEEENNRYWIDAYGLGDELTPEVPDDQITIRRADLGRDVRSLLSYAVGCMMGRYSLDEPGLIHAGQPFDAGRHQKFAADKDGILPVTTDAYFEDDVASRFREFLRVAFGPEPLDANMDWVAASLGGQKAGESAEERIRRYFAAEFMSDHIQTYKKRPIYWLFTSGKKRGFGALVYLHRYNPDTLARLRTDYLLPLQGMLEARRGRLEAEKDAAGSTAAKRQAEKALAGLAEQVAEVHKYDESLRHAADLRIALDLDDGVAYNYWLMSAAGQNYLTVRSSRDPVKGLQDLVYSGIDLKLADLEKKSQWKRDLLAQEARA